MRIRRIASSGVGLLPEAYEYLSAAPQVRGDGKKTERLPLGIYNVSIRRAVRSLSGAVEELESLQRRGVHPREMKGLTWMEPVLERQMEVLNAMQAHTDDCGRIASGATGKPLKNEKRYLSITADYRDRVSRIANHVKHHGGRLRPFAFYTSSEFFPGYFAEGVDEAGALGPEPTVHKGGQGAFSFSRDLRLHFVWIYGLSRALSEVIAARAAASPLETQPSVGQEKFRALANKIQSSPFRLYPDERSLPVPSVHLEGEDGATELELSYADGVAVEVVPKGPRLHIATSWQGDGVTKTFRLPYPARRGTEGRYVLRRDES